MNLENLTPFEKTICSLQVAASRFKSSDYHVTVQYYSQIEGLDVYLHNKRYPHNVKKGWEIKPDTTTEKIADVIAQLEFLQLDSPVESVS